MPVSVKSCESKYNDALSLLSIPSQENIEKAYLMMSKLAAEDKYLPAIKWMANYNETVLGDYKEAAFWYRQSMERQTRETVEPKTEGPKERTAESIAPYVPDTVSMGPSSQSRSSKPESFPHDSVISEAKYESDSQDNHSKGKKRGPFAGIAIALALLIGIGTWCYFTFFRVKGIELNSNSVDLSTKDEAKITAIVYPERLQDKVKVRWSSSDPNVAKVSEFGTITAVGEGNCTVIAKAGNKSASVEVSVYRIESISLDTNDILLMPNESITVNASIWPESSAGAKLTWTSSDDSVATVDYSGLIKAVGKGACTISAEAGGIEASVDVEVTLLTVEERLIAGKWSIAGIDEGEEYTNWQGIDAPLQLNSDHTGYFTLTESNYFTWEFEGLADEAGCYLYRVYIQADLDSWLYYNTNNENLVLMIYRGEEFLFHIYYLK